MTRPKPMQKPIRLEILVPEDLHTAATLELFSPLEGRVPYGAWQTLFRELLKGWLDQRGVRNG